MIFIYILEDKPKCVVCFSEVFDWHVPRAEIVTFTHEELSPREVWDFFISVNVCTQVHLQVAVFLSE